MTMYKALQFFKLEAKDLETKDLKEVSQIYMGLRKSQGDVDEDDFDEYLENLSTAYSVIKEHVTANKVSTTSSTIPNSIFPVFKEIEFSSQVMGETIVMGQDIGKESVAFVGNDSKLQIPIVIPADSEDGDVIKVSWKGKFFITVLKVLNVNKPGVVV